MVSDTYWTNCWDVAVDKKTSMVFLHLQTCTYTCINRYCSLGEIRNGYGISNYNQSVNFLALSPFSLTNLIKLEMFVSVNRASLLLKETQNFVKEIQKYGSLNKY